MRNVKVIVPLAIIVIISAALRFLWLNTIPVGWHHDEAMMGLMATEVFRGIDRPIFFTAYTGQEPLYIYLSAGMMWLLGGADTILPLRATSAVVGLATVVITYFLGSRLFDRRVGLLSAALLGFSFWQVLLSRDGYRVITQPLFEGLAVLLLWEAAKRKSSWWYGAAGIARRGPSGPPGRARDPLGVGHRRDRCDLRRAAAGRLRSEGALSRPRPPAPRSRPPSFFMWGGERGD
jgi:4-amino-4-deoxy-L-arabinose transferase-like glycosyltransferase